MNRTFLGCTLGLILGVMTLLSAFNLVQVDGKRFVNTFNAGVSVIVCSLAYRSAKRRYLRLAPPTRIRYITEWVGVLLTTGLVFGRNDVLNAIATDPFQTLVMPVWGLVAYLTMTFRQPRISTTHEDPSKSQRIGTSE